MTNILRRLNDDMTAMLEGAGRSLVHVSSGPGGGGAGTVWHPDGLVMTNAHVARQDVVEVSLSDGRSLSGKVLAADDGLDLAAIMVEASDLPTISPGESLIVRPGQWVVAIGHPWGISGAATAGAIIGLESERWGHTGSPRELLAVNIQLRPGNSGGPLLDAQGRLIGINTMMNGSEVGLAVPVHVVKRFLKQRLGDRGESRAASPRRTSPPHPVPA